MKKKWSYAGNPWMVVIPLGIIAFLLAGGVVRSIDFREASAHAVTIRSLFENPRGFSDGLFLKFENGGFVEPWVHNNVPSGASEYEIYESQMHTLNDPRIRLVSPITLPMGKRLMIIGKWHRDDFGGFLVVYKYYEMIEGGDAIAKNR